MMEPDKEYVRWYPLRWHPIEPVDLDPMWRPLHSSHQGDLSIYIHFPFCAPPCDFCPYLKEHYSESRANLWTESIIDHVNALALDGFFRGRSIRSIYWGGGTPSLASVEQIAAIIDSLARHADLSSLAEVSLEARPRPGIAEYLLTLRREIQLSRCTLGVQSFDPNLLMRIGSKADIREIENEIGRLINEVTVGIDLLYNCPSQRTVDFERDLTIIIELGVHQVSLYELVLTPNEKLWKYVQDQTAVGSRSSEMLELALSILPVHGLIPILVSDFAQPGRHGVYQLEHWRSPQLEVLGLGPGAISYFGGYQYANLASLDAYCTSLQKNRQPVLAGMSVTSNEELNRNFVLGFKAMEVDIGKIRSVFKDLVEVHRNAFEFCIEAGWIERKGDLYRLTTKGMWYIDNVSKQFYSFEMNGAETPCEPDLIRWTEAWMNSNH